MKAPEFEGRADPVAADNWLLEIQVILDFMRLTDQEKILCASFALKKDARHWWRVVQMKRNVLTMSWQDFMDVFRMKYYNEEVLAVQQDEFLNFTQGTLSVMEAAQKFDQLARMCPNLVPNESDEVRLMMKMFRADIAQQVSAGSSPPRTVADCVGRAVRAEYWIGRRKEATAQFFKSRKEEKAMAKTSQQKQPSETAPRGQNNNQAQGSRPFGRNKRKGNWNNSNQGQ